MAVTTAPAKGIGLPVTIIGIGIGGFVDGILLHQVLQWHHMLSSTNDDNVGVRDYPVNTVSGLEMNTLWDGFFHVVCWLAVLIGLAMLYARLTHDRARLWTSGVLWGRLAMGWGIFNLVEGIVDHHILGIHHVRADEYRTWWDLGFLLLGLVLLVGGWMIARRARPVR
ncbi:DUF2243 domain-containing protein [Bailinhaonella thermotolerans]|uniref:DUF2243 domain-containing protein n=1 Tax=Bailinhaonella thermotolerans TaxID=1070861 RepID=A0A3A4ARD6_9ACTN|nr:DUF2243 domain-containing protein [Bailinhaonella thermotolerans]RJL32408.1 DUF2243 domain-containing protein [Bailinhaonella thermotolerans]